jgi:hypothetical protein
MAILRNPQIFTRVFNIQPAKLKNIGVFNPVLNIDTKLFIDPLLLHKSKSIIIKNSAQKYKLHFERLLKFLKESKISGDVNWKLARELFDFQELSGTCLGYGAGSTRGSRISKVILDDVINTASAIIKQGVEDPDIFLIAFMLQEGIGADNLSDMVTNIIIKDIAKYTEKVAKELNVPVKIFSLGTPSEKFSLPYSPKNQQHILLLPKDILRKLPIALTRSDVSTASAQNAAIRNSANMQIGAFFRATTKNEKKKAKDAILQNKNTLLAILAEYKNTTQNSYDFSKDVDGLMIWRENIFDILKENPFVKIKNYTSDEAGIKEIVSKIINQFQTMIENNGVWELLYFEGKGRNEKFLQKLFFIAADAFCKANNIDISPETDSGGGPVDFKFSNGYDKRVLVELKLSTNSSVVSGYSKQLETYKNASKPIAAHYVIVETSKSITVGQKKQLNAFKQDLKTTHQVDSEILIIDGSKQVSASKKR